MVVIQCISSLGPSSSWTQRIHGIYRRFQQATASECPPTLQWLFSTQTRHKAWEDGSRLWNGWWHPSAHHQGFLGAAQNIKSQVEWKVSICDRRCYWSLSFGYLVEKAFLTNTQIILIWRDLDDENRSVIDVVASLNQVQGLRGLGRYFKVKWASHSAQIFDFPSSSGSDPKCTE